MSDYSIKCVLQNSEKVNLDELLKLLLCFDDLETIKQDLLKAYFIVSDWCTEDDCNVTETSRNALKSLRNFIEALQDVNKPEQAKIRLVIKK